MPKLVQSRPPVANSGSSPSPEEIKAQLSAILASPAFLGSKRCQQFLEYVCLRYIAGDLGSLKERSIAIEVFGRSPQTHLGDDTIVRVSAREVRKRLAQYYVTEAGMNSAIVIDLPSGSYVPEVRYESAPLTETVEAIEPAVRPSGAPRWKFAAAAVLLIVLAASGSWLYLRYPSNQNKQAFNSFWLPVLSSNEPMLVAVGHPIVYHASWRAHRLSEQKKPAATIPAQTEIQVAPELLNGSDIIPVKNQYVGYGDLVAANEVSKMLARHNKDVRVRLASSLELSDLRQTQTFLIGAITNRWTMELQSGWRFQFARSGEQLTVIRDTQSNPPVDWAIPAKEDGSTAEDYILVCRVKTPMAGGLQIVVAGLKQFGTEAGGRLVADPEQIGAILRTLEPGWENRNVQLVLHSRVIGNTPTQPEVVAKHLW